MLVFWATGDDLPTLYGDVLGVWRDWADDLRGRGLQSGHHLSEDVPEELAAEIHGFVNGPFGGARRGDGGHSAFAQG